MVIISISLILITSCINFIQPVEAISTRAPNKYPPYLYNGSVTPQSGDTSTLFTYQVTCIDIDAVQPVNKYVYIDGAPVSMTVVSTAGFGATYQFKTTLWGGNHTFYFYFSDTKYSDRLPTSYDYQAPNVTGPGGSWMPQLSQGSVSPQLGTPSTVFTYQVTYIDVYNSTPLIYDVYIDGFPFSMTYVSGFYSQGAIYQYQTTLGVGNHTFYFFFNNTNGNVSLPYYGTYYGPAVTYGNGSQPNNPPTLSNGLVNPQIGTPSTLFTYQVTYTDLDNNPPIVKNVYIDGTSHTMNYISGALSQGAIYQYQTTLSLGSNHSYYFSFADWNASARLPLDGAYNAPMVTESPPPNSPPTLSSGSVAPTSGTTATIFTFQVTYTDLDNYPPALKYVYIDGLPYVMDQISGYYSGGAIFQYQTKLLIGVHNYYFYFSDGLLNSRLPTQGSYSGPSVAADGPPPNKVPTLYNGTVTPQSGNISTKFAYQVYYQDLDGDPPTLKNVYIDGLAYTMSYVSGSYNTGTLYQYNTTVPGGNHTYSFSFSDGQANVKLPIYGTYNGPSVAVPSGPNKAPLLYNGSVTPQSGNSSTLFTYNVTYQDQDNDTPVIKIVVIDNHGYKMSYVSGNFTAGALYQYTTKLSPGNHTYYFYFSDGKVSERLPVNGSYSAPNVTGTLPNNLPILYSGSLYPSTGTTSTVFTYQIIYKDLDNNPPTIKNIYIDGTPHAMNIKYGSYNLGALYEYKTTLNLGTHNFYFYFSDGIANVRLPLSGTYSGPVVSKPNRPPIAEAGPDQTVTVGPPNTVYLDGSKSFDPNNDTLIYYWDFMDGDYTIGMNVSHIFHGVGDYNVSLTIWDGQFVDRDYCVIHVIDSGQGKTKGKAPEKHPSPGFEGFAVIMAMGAVMLILHLKRRRM